MNFTYYDHSKPTWNKGWTFPILFQCSANSILEADQLYQKAIGDDVTKQKHVGCEITCNPPNNVIGS